MPTPVLLHIYDVFGHEAVRGVNLALRPLGTGAFHGAVEVDGREWSFGYSQEGGTGVFCCPPRGCTQHHYRECVPMGATQLQRSEIAALIQALSEEWPAKSYDLLRRNCCTFCDEFCYRLGVGRVPRWVTNLAGAGATLQDGLQAAASQAQAAAIIAVAKAEEIDQEFRVRGTVDAKAKDVLATLQALDQKHGLSTRAAKAVAEADTRLRELDNKAADMATKAGTTLQELDAKHGLTVKAADAITTAGATLQDLDAKHGISAGAAQAVQRAGSTLQELDEKHRITAGATEIAERAVDGVRGFFDRWTRK